MSTRDCKHYMMGSFLQGTKKGHQIRGVAGKKILGGPCVVMMTSRCNDFAKYWGGGIYVGRYDELLSYHLLHWQFIEQVPCSCMKKWYTNRGKISQIGLN